jgi:hypothetical protein
MTLYYDVQRWTNIIILRQDVLVELASAPDGLVECGLYFRQTSMWMPVAIGRGRWAGAVRFRAGVTYLTKLCSGPIDAPIKDMPNLIIVPTGALTELPFRLLVTEQAAVTVPKLEDIATYRVAYFAIHRLVAAT